MKTIKVDVYDFHELSEEAKENALEWARELDYVYGWHNENEESLKAFASFVGGKPAWSISLWGKSWAEIQGVNIDIPAKEWVEDNYYKVEKTCPFTGYCFDETLLDPIRDFMKNPDEDTTLDELAQKSAKAWAKAYVEDWKYAYSDEGLADFISVNYKFTEDGERVSNKLLK